MTVCREPERLPLQRKSEKAPVFIPIFARSTSRFAGGGGPGEVWLEYGNLVRLCKYGRWRGRGPVWTESQLRSARNKHPFMEIEEFDVYVTGAGRVV